MKIILFSWALLIKSGVESLVKVEYWKVAKGSLVMMKGKMNRSLYAIEGSTISDLANVSTNKMSDLDINLWHLRFDHIGERGMYELSKQGLFDGKKFGNLEFCEHCIWEIQES